MAIVKGNSLRIFSCKNEKVPIMVERANFRGLKVSQRSGSLVTVKECTILLEFLEVKCGTYKC